jgi:hypothetical protein
VRVGTFTKRKRYGEDIMAMTPEERAQYVADEITNPLESYLPWDGLYVIHKSGDRIALAHPAPESSLEEIGSMIAFVEDAATGT